jgi:hypothetical protein
MKKVSFLFICIVLLGLSSCDLDRFPYSSIVKDEAFKTIEDATAFNNAFYAHLRGSNYGIWATAPDIQSDIFHSTIDYGNRRGSVYKWEFISTDYDIRDIWQGSYSYLTNINNFLENVDLIPTTKDDEKAKLNVFKGEAYFLRAFYFEKLIKRYAKDYEPSTAATDLGIPLTLKFDVNALPARATVQEVYDQILADIAAAKPLLTTAGAKGSSKLTKDCITALEARVYLDIHKYSDAVNAANTLINSGTYPLVNTQEELEKIWVDDAADETIFLLFASNPNELSNTNSQYLGFNGTTKKYTPDFVPEKWVVDLFDVSDIRKSVYLKVLPTYVGGMDFDIFLLNKYPGNPALYTGNTNYQHRLKIFRIAEAHLIKAEALAWDNKDADALAALNVLRTSRGLTAVTLTGAALKTEIQDERTREFLAEGTRLDDLKRWKLGFTRGESQEDYVTDANYSSLSKSAGDSKFVWAIPSRDLTTNPNLVQNPGWE